MGKLFTSVINSRLQEFANEFNLLEENQTGFRKNYSTIDNVFSLHALLELMSRNKKKNVLCLRRLPKSVRYSLAGGSLGKAE